MTPQRIQLSRKKAGRSKASTYVVLACRTCGRPGAKGQQGFCSPVCRFWARVNKTDTCWLWSGPSNSGKGSYGRFGADGQRWLAHRYAYTLLVGPIPPGYELDHVVCAVTRCVRPEHLEPVTPEEHERRSDQGAYNRRKTHCPQGHPYTEENTRPVGSSGRACRRCGSPGWGLKGSHNGNSKLTEVTVRDARRRRHAGERVDDLARAYGVAQSVMSRALAGVTWGHVR